MINMPFSTITRPALGLSLLKSGLRKNGISSKIYYFNLEFAKVLGFDNYEELSTGSSTPLLGELIFSPFIKDFETTKDNLLVTRALESPHILEESAGLNAKKLRRIQEMIPEFLDSCADEVLRERPEMIGFSSTFEQNCASLALARRIKYRETIPIIFGGANCEGDMGITLLRLFPYVDFVCSGEGDKSFIEFAKCISKLNRRKIDGILSRNSTPLEVAMTAPISQMDMLPFPDFDDYFHPINSNSFEGFFEPELIIETSRGCWWGEKFHCTFCGLNGSTMKYRSKSVGRVIAELKYLRLKHGIRKFYIVDNIMDLKYINALFPKIVETGLDVELFYETKSNLSRTQLRIMKKGGVSMIQPGIESLSKKILGAIEKGVTGTTNIELLKWCRELDVIPLWNWLWGIPNEPFDEYDRMAEFVPLLTHLHPPEFVRIIMDRFSPYFMSPGSFGICNVRPLKLYTLVYSLADEEELNKIAYHFDFDFNDGRDPSKYTEKLRQQLKIWNSLWKRKGGQPSLNMMKERDGSILIEDSRPASIKRHQVLDNLEAVIYNICETSHAFSNIEVAIRNSYPEVKEEYLYQTLHDLLKRKLMIHIEEKYLALAIPAAKWS
jgi:ribosomal peptide maturation radical SAM protein 1